MSDPIEDGGPAYPVPLLEGETWNGEAPNGMTLRDYFAGQALQFLIHADKFNSPAEVTAEQAYLYADEMLKARHK